MTKTLEVATISFQKPEPERPPWPHLLQVTPLPTGKACFCTLLFYTTFSQIFARFSGSFVKDQSGHRQTWEWFTKNLYLKKTWFTKRVILKDVEIVKFTSSFFRRVGGITENAILFVMGGGDVNKPPKVLMSFKDGSPTPDQLKTAQ